MDSTGSIFSPPDAINPVVNNEIPEVTAYSVEFRLYVILPANVNWLMPFALSPFEAIYPTSIKFPSSSFLPKIPSPKISSYLSSSISCRKKTLESWLISKRLSCRLYFVELVDCSLFLTKTEIKSVSIPLFGRINLWFRFLEL